MELFVSFLALFSLHTSNAYPFYYVIQCCNIGNLCWQ